MKNEKIVLRFQDKSLMKGRTFDFSPDKPYFHFRLLTGERVKIKTDKLKAAFTVKSFGGDRSYKYTYRDVLPWEGRKVRVLFNDGEEMTGYISHHLAGSDGFFLTPADIKGNNIRVFIVNSATKEVVYL